ncbi:MAG: hypothetical protein WKI04_10715 [Ferruginibacter sp.]
MEDTPARSPIGIGTGSAIIIFRNDTDPAKPEVVYEAVKLEWDGRFTTKVTEKAENINFRAVQAYYLPGNAFGDCYSEIIEKK